ncbi:hypothetical protein CISIN_1g034765mg [Citrus sinensis]|uniref:Uncharacterized protein n=1 Tax=Citrus sinensis TaxID=2711 RepID=A0A067FV05_CITSI|nr:hypothetical protein CISIN_1g034765mg [Citrus sinensis]
MRSLVQKILDEIKVFKRATKESCSREQISSWVTDMLNCHKSLTYHVDSNSLKLLEGRQIPCSIEVARISSKRAIIIENCRIDEY